MIDSLKATFKKRPGKKHIYQQSMMLAMLLSMMAGGEMYCQFMYTKRMFQWKMDKESHNYRDQYNDEPFLFKVLLFELFRMSPL